MLVWCKDEILLSTSQPLKNNFGGHKVLSLFLSSPIRNKNKMLFPLSCISSRLGWTQDETIYRSDRVVLLLLCSVTKEPLDKGILSYQVVPYLGHNVSDCTSLPFYRRIS